MLKVCGITVISKIEFFNIFATEKVKHKWKKLEIIQNLLSLKENNFSSNAIKSRAFSWFFTERLTLSLPVTHCAGHNTDLHLNSNFSKTVRVNNAFTRKFFKEHLRSFVMISRSVDFTLRFSSYWCLTFLGLIESQKSSFLIFWYWKV